jgi:hypothetical protein
MGIKKIIVNDILGFSRKLTRWSQITEIFNRTRQETIDSSLEAKYCLSKLKSAVSDSTNFQNISFLLELLNLSMVHPSGRRYSLNLVHIAIEIFLSSRCCYRVLSNFLPLPHFSSFKKQLCGLNNVGTLKECQKLISNVFDSIEPRQRNCIAMFDEMYIKPSVRYRGGHLLGYSVDKPSQPAKTISMKDHILENGKILRTCLTKRKRWVYVEQH